MRQTYEFRGPSFWDRVTFAARDAWQSLSGRRTVTRRSTEDDRDER